MRLDSSTVLLLLTILIGMVLFITILERENDDLRERLHQVETICVKNI